MALFSPRAMNGWLLGRGLSFIKSAPLESSLLSPPLVLSEDTTPRASGWPQPPQPSGGSALLELMPGPVLGFPSSLAWSKLSSAHPCTHWRHRSSHGGREKGWILATVQQNLSSLSFSNISMNIDGSSILSHSCPERCSEFRVIFLVHEHSLRLQHHHGISGDMSP